MKVIREKKDLRRVIRNIKGKRKIGLVPTMGYLHEGHLSLVRIGRQKSDYLVVSIFVNPTQFGPDEDLKDYPRDLNRDLELLSEEGVNLVFAPSDDEMYKADHSTFVDEEKLSQNLCGRFRTDHFRGVATIVVKLFNLITPDLVVFGLKDYQQARIIERIVRDLDYDIEIVAGPTIRESDGLALSSRNEYLSPDERKRAVVLYRSLKQAEKMIRDGIESPEQIYQKMREMIKEAGGRIEYVEIVDPVLLRPLDRIEEKTLIALAVRFGKSRLIDNLVVEPIAPEAVNN